MKNKLILLSVLLFCLFNQAALSQEEPDVVSPTGQSNGKELVGDISKLFQPTMLPSVFGPRELTEPEATFINFDDVVITYDNSEEIAPNRYPGVSFYSPFSGVSTWATYSNRYSFPNSLIVGHVCNTSLGTICSWHVLVIDFAQDSRDVAFLWGRDLSYGGGTIEVYTGSNYQLAANISVGLPNIWTGFNLSQYTNIRRLVLRHPAQYTPNTTGHIFIDNFQFTPTTTHSPLGYFDSVSIEQGAALGWSVDPDNTSANNTVHCYIDNQFAGATIANLPGPGVPYPGNHRFSLPIPIQYRDGNNHTMNCYGLDHTGNDPVTVLIGSPKTFKFNAPIGWLDSVAASFGEEEEEEDPETLGSDGVAKGWSIDIDIQRRSNFVHFYINGPAGGGGTFAGEAYANVPRPDVNQQTGYIGNHGYEWSIPDQYRDGAPHTIYAYGLDLTGDNSRHLQGSPKTFTLPPRIYSVAFEEINSALTANPNAGGGRRIFPDNQSPNDLINRKKVLVKATISPAQANRMVYFKKYDLDDPSTDAAPVDPNGNQGNDNRGEAGTPYSAGTFFLIGGCVSNQNGISCPTDANGVARIEFWTTMQPGDNYAVAASYDRNYLEGIAVNGIDLLDSNGSPISQTTFIPPARAKRTEMLTVWRNLHIEADSMGVGQNNHIEDTFFYNRKVGVGYPVIQVNVTPPLEPDRFQNGRLETGGRSFEIFENTANSVSIINNSVFNITPGQTFKLYDDDDFNLNDGTVQSPLRGDEGEDIPLLEKDFLQENDTIPANINTTNSNALAAAYIRPKYDLGGSGEDVPFIANVAADNGPAIRSLFHFDNFNTEASAEFWTVYLLSAYQHTLDRDGDPVSERIAGNVYAGVSDAQMGQGSLVFFEINNTRECTGTSFACSLAATKVHEIGHLINADHNQGGIMDGLDINFSPTSLNLIRNILHP